MKLTWLTSIWTCGDKTTWGSVRQKNQLIYGLIDLLFNKPIDLTSKTVSLSVRSISLFDWGTEMCKNNPAEWWQARGTQQHPHSLQRSLRVHKTQASLKPAPPLWRASEGYSSGIRVVMSKIRGWGRLAVVNYTKLYTFQPSSLTFCSCGYFIISVFASVELVSPLRSLLSWIILLCHLLHTYFTRHLGTWALLSLIYLCTHTFLHWGETGYAKTLHLMAETYAPKRKNTVAHNLTYNCFRTRSAWGGVWPMYVLSWLPVLPNRECLCGIQGKRLERVGEADAERQGCSHTFYSGLFACLIAVCVCVPAAHAGGLMHDVIV